MSNMLRVSAVVSETDKSAAKAEKKMRGRRSVSARFGYALASLLVIGCSNSPVVELDDGNVLVTVDLNLQGSRWIVNVFNRYGRASDEIFAASDRRRSNLYLTPSNQLVVIEQGGESAFFALPAIGRPVALNEQRLKERDTASERWRFVGVIAGKSFVPDAVECIPLLGEGFSPYRRQYQMPHHC
ncbi:hypothetical protein ABC347_02085 [Sphingomonas sp. 1P06PA]|uniref:hypothetical protein n=1 Tax=Sphingomonas sp. 1P06PA TaxID=554121 RepID=UPI0039A58E75